MVTSRSVGSFADLQQRKTLEYFKKFARQDILLYKTSGLTTNAMGRISGFTDLTPTTIIGDLQFVTYQDKQLIELGWAKVGDGIFYTTYDAVIVPEDLIKVDSTYWELSKQVEAEQTLGSTVYQGWIAIRKPEV